MNPKLRTALIEKGLTAREADVAIVVAKGKPSKEVAKELFVNEKTIKFHLTKIYKKLGLKSRAQLIVWCLPYLGFEMPDVVERVVVVNQEQKPPTGLPIGGSNGTI